LVMEYLFTALGAVPQIIASLKEKKDAAISRKMAGLPVA